MAKVIAIMGESGSGKTTAMRNLDPSTTYYIDCDGKGLSWKGWKDQYIKSENYSVTDYPSLVERILLWLNGQQHDSSGEIVDSDNKKGLVFKTVVVDTLNGIMVGQEMRDITKKGYDKWTDLATHIWSLLTYALKMRDDLTVIFLCHSETVSDDNGVVETHIKTSGRKLRKMVPESKLNTVLLAEYTADGRYILWTRKPGTTAKAPMGAFNEEYVDNDIVEVLKRLEEF